MTPSPVITIDSLDDPRLAHYRNLKDRDLAAQGGLFIAEGEAVTRRLLASDFEVESVLAASQRAGRIIDLPRGSAPLYLVDHTLVNRIVGFKFHSGILAVGRRRPSPTLAELARDWPARVMLVVCPEIANTENLGALVRIAAGFGATAMLLGEHCCDPFYRQAIRVSMGTVFSLPLIRSQDIVQDLRALKTHGVELAATVLDEQAQPLAQAQASARMALLLGNEAQGLPPHLVSLCDRKLTIPMQLGTDSLNVYVAAGVLLFHFTQGAGRL